MNGIKEMTVLEQPATCNLQHCCTSHVENSNMDDDHKSEKTASVFHIYPTTYYSLCPIKSVPLDPSIRKSAGILPKRHGIIVELNDMNSCMYNIKSGRKSLNVQNRVFCRKNRSTSSVKGITRHHGRP
jgi:hypothetical protein